RMSASQWSEDASQDETWQVRKACRGLFRQSETRCERMHLLTSKRSIANEVVLLHYDNLKKIRVAQSSENLLRQKLCDQLRSILNHSAIQIAETSAPKTQRTLRRNH